MKEKGVALGAEPVRVPVWLDAKARVELAPAAEKGEGSVLLNIEGIVFDRAPDLYYEVYLNLPEGQKPDPQGPYFAGNLAFFGLEPHDDAGHGHGDKPRGGVHSYNITRLVRELKRRQRWNEEQLNVTLIPRGPELPGGKEGPAAPLRGSNPRFSRVTVTNR